jgi:hypothetical protein
MSDSRTPGHRHSATNSVALGIAHDPGGCPGCLIAVPSLLGERCVLEVRSGCQPLPNTFWIGPGPTLGLFGSAGPMSLPGKLGGVYVSTLIVGCSQ